MHKPDLSVCFLGHSREPFVLPNGVYVRMGEELPEFFRNIAAFTAGGSPEDYLAPTIPPDQSTEDVILGKYGHYGISPVTPKDVNSEAFNNCFCLTACGTNVENENEELALLAHVVPGPGVLNSKRELQEHLALRVAELRSKTRQGTRSVLIAGGILDCSSQEALHESSRDCVETTAFLAEACQPLNVEPRSFQPAMGDHHRYLSLATQHRQLLMRSKGHPVLSQGHLLDLPAHFPSEHAAKNIEQVITWYRRRFQV